MENDKLKDETPEEEIGNNDNQDQITMNDFILKIITDIKNAFKNKTFAIILRSTLISLIAILSVLLLFILFIYVIPLFQELPSGERISVTNFTDLKKEVDYKKQITTFDRDIQRLSRKYNSYTSGLSYLVINTTDNQFYLYRNKKLIREGFCSSGSYKMLKTAEGRSWIFKTPKGKFWIQGKTTHPSWRRPDWSFVEEGSPIPSPNDPSRYEYGVLGDYALALGDGYLIHGTLYKRFLGMPVTHGCVRLNDDDLEAVFNNLSIGSKVYIF
jgi:hypothetical protein